jgi:beta-glucosidase
MVRIALGYALAVGVAVAASAADRPWMDKTLSPDARAALVVQQLTLDEKLRYVHGYYGGNLNGIQHIPQEWIADLPNSAGYIPPVTRLGIPALKETDAGLGVANHRHMREGDTATALPSGLLTAATFNPALAYEVGSVLGREARDKGFNVVLGGAVNLTREPRGGRSFEYAGEDPLLAGIMVGEQVRGTQAQGVISTVKHFALNFQETARTSISANIAWPAARESDLLAFELAIERSQPGAVMCSYNRVNGTYGCENSHLLTKVLKQDWGFPGWVMSDWGAVHSTVEAANAGLDQESAFLADSADFFGEPLKTAIIDGKVSQARLDDMVGRILRSAFAAGVIDNPPKKAPTDLRRHADIVQRTAEQGIVLLKNDGVLPLAANAKTITVIGGHADLGVLSGGGSSQVIPVGDTPETEIPVGGPAFKFPGLGWVRQPAMVFDPPSPLAEITHLAGKAKVRFADGKDVAAAVRLAKASDIVIVFANQWMRESEDVPDLFLPDGQNEMIAAIAAANRHTIIVLQTGGPVLMPWLSAVPAVLEAWYSGNRGGAAIANILFGKANPSGRLPVSFPDGEHQLAHPEIVGKGTTTNPYAPGVVPPPLAGDYFEGADIGYRWFAKQGSKPLFAFGHGLSYTRFSYGGLKLEGGSGLVVRFTVKNSGTRAGAETAQVYVTPPGGTSVARLVGWVRVDLKPGQTREVAVTAEPRTMAAYQENPDGWRLAAGLYTVAVGGSAVDLRLTGAVDLSGATLKP